MPSNITSAFKIRQLLLAASIFCACSTTVTYADATDELQQLRAQDPNLVVTWNETQQQARYLSGQLSANGYKNANSLVEEFIQQHRSLLGTTSDTKLTLSKTATTPAGQMLTYTQTHHGLEVVGGKLVARLHQGQLRTIANHLITDIRLAPEPIIDKATAIQLAGQENKRISTSSSKINQADLVYFHWERKTHLAWRIQFASQLKPTPTRYQTWVNAQDGTIILNENRISELARPAQAKLTTKTSTAKAFKPATLPALFSLNLAANELETFEAAIGSGVGHNGKLKKFKTTLNNNDVYLLASEQGKNPTMSYATYSYAVGLDTIRLLKDKDNVWKDPSAVDAYSYAVNVLNLYRSLGDLSWWQDSGLSNGVLSVIHYSPEDIAGIGYDNAFWNGQYMVYGDGHELFKPLAGSFDIVSHELTHAVTEATTNLIYCNEPGALNESWSDVMSMLFSLKRGYANPYLLSDDAMLLTTPSRYALRRMDDPSFRSDEYPENDYSAADPLNSWGQPAHTDEQYRVRRCTNDNDSGGVHINSGIPNRAAYLITQAIGMQASLDIYYQSLFYLSSTASFKDARAAVIQSAIDLYGSQSSVIGKIKTAFNTVGIKH